MLKRFEQSRTSWGRGQGHKGPNYDPPPLRSHNWLELFSHPLRSIDFSEVRCSAHPPLRPFQPVATPSLSFGPFILLQESGSCPSLSDCNLRHNL